MDLQLLAATPGAADNPRIPFGPYLQTPGRLDRSILHARTSHLQAMDPHFGFDRFRRLQADADAVPGFAQGRFPSAAGTAEGGVAVTRQVHEQAARAAGDGAAGDIDHRARPVFPAAPPGFLAQAFEGHWLAANLVQETVAGATVGELLVDEMVLKGAFGGVQEAALAGQAPQREVEPQPIRYSAAFVAVALLVERFLDPARGQEMAVCEDLPIPFRGVAPTLLAGQGIEVGEPAHGAEPAMAVQAVEVGDGGGQRGDAFRLVQVTLVLRHAGQANHAFDAREVAGDKAVRVATTDAANVLRLVADRVGGNEIATQPFCQRQRARVIGAVIDLDQAAQQAAIAPQDGHVPPALDLRQMLVGAEVTVGFLI